MAKLKFKRHNFNVEFLNDMEFKKSIEFHRCITFTTYFGNLVLARV